MNWYPNWGPPPWWQQPPQQPQQMMPMPRGRGKRNKAAGKLAKKIEELLLKDAEEKYTKKPEKEKKGWDKWTSFDMFLLMVTFGPFVGLLYLMTMVFMAKGLVAALTAMFK